MLKALRSPISDLNFNMNSAGGEAISTERFLARGNVESSRSKNLRYTVNKVRLFQRRVLLQDSESTFILMFGLFFGKFIQFTSYAFDAY